MTLSASNLKVMSSYKDLLAQREALEQKIAAARESELSQAVSRVRGLIEEFGLTQDDVFGKGARAPSAKKGSKVAAKFRDPATGATWTGRGKPPKWIAGKDREQFAI